MNFLMAVVLMAALFMHGGEQLSYADKPVVVAGVLKDSAAQKAYLTSSETWTVAPESLAGAIYYWSVSRSSSTAVGFISRLRPGTGATPEKLYGGECVG